MQLPDWQAYSLIELGDLVSAIASGNLTIAETRYRLDTLEKELSSYFTESPDDIPNTWTPPPMEAN